MKLRSVIRKINSFLFPSTFLRCFQCGLSLTTIYKRSINDIDCLTIKKSTRPVSRILFSGSPEFYHLSMRSTPPGPGRNLPGRATLNGNAVTGIYLILQPIRRTASCITAGPGGLLPRLLTFTPI
jgi:hypothetical protein